MSPTDILKQEHRVIEPVLACLTVLADRADAGRLDPADARQALDFLQVFADRCHHGKEEDHLFPRLEARGFSRERGPTGVMLHEHELGRQAIRAMLTALDAGRPADFARPARDYARLLQDHIAKEDHCLFAMADQVLTPHDQEELQTAFAAVEHQDLPAGAHEHYVRLAQDLAARLGVAPLPSAAAPAHACGQ